MELYYSPGACSLAPHIVLNELALHHEPVRVSLLKGETHTPEFLKLNPMGAVPVLVMNDGQPLTEIAAILQYLVDLKPEAGLAPPNGTLERVRLQETLNFISTELHKGFGPIWGAHHYVADKAAQTELKENAVQGLTGAFDVLEEKVAGRTWIMSSGYTVADAYFFTIFNWCRFHGIPQEKWPNLKSIQDRVRARPAVQKTFEIEGLK